MTSIAIAAFFLWLAGVVKGAIGAGAPVLAVPPLVLLYDVRTAVIVMLAQNLFVNLWQLWKFRDHVVSPKLAALYAVPAGIGAALGSYLLVFLSTQTLSLFVAVGVLIYIAFRLLNAGWKLSLQRAMNIAVPMGFMAGAMQGATGISAPFTIGFMSALKLAREQFIATISIFFVAMTIVQLPTLFALNALSWSLVMWSLLALLPIMAGLPVGQWLIRRTSREMFDRIILLFLVGLALKLIYEAFV